MQQNAALLGVARVNRIMQGLQDPRLIPQDLVWNRRIPNVPASNDEIMARFVGTIQIADMVMDDAKAAIYSMGRLQYETTKVPNLKVGMGMGQGTIDILERLSNNTPGMMDDVMFSAWQTRALMAVRTGVEQRMEQLKVAMLCDGVGFAYDRFGIKLTAPSWGLYSDLKVTVGTGWDTAATATPVNDLWALIKLARVRYGITLDRVSMGTTAFQYMIATTEFQNKARTYLAPNVSYTNLTLSDLNTQRIIAQNVLGVEVELYDARYWSQDVAGAITQAPYLPIVNVILTSKSMDGNSAAWDFANGVVTESVVSRIANTGVIGGRLPGAFGPVAYVTPSDQNMNPPGLVHWGVARGFPRKHVLQSSAVLTVGSFTESISTTVPFPQ